MTTDTPTMAMPTAAEAEGWMKVLGACLAVAGIVGAGLVRSWRWWTGRRALRRIESRAIRYLLDADYHALRLLDPLESERLHEPDVIHRQALLIEQIREELWIADGHASRDDQGRIEEIAATVMRRTLAIDAKKAREIRQELQRIDERKQDMFAPDSSPEDDRQ